MATRKKSEGAEATAPSTNKLPKRETQHSLALTDSARKGLDSALERINKQFGVGTVRKMNETVDLPITPIPSGSIALDRALGRGGYPQGRIIEIYGPESSGKTTLALHAIAEVQGLGGVAAFVDAEHALDLKYASNLGVNVDDLLISQPDCGEHALEIVDQLMRSGGVALIVVDSVAALTPRAELEGEMGDTHVGLQARLMSQALRKLVASTQKMNTTIIFLNQLRMKIGVSFGSPETTTGGNALKYYTSQRIDIRRIGTNKQDGVAESNKTRVKVAKNKVANPFREAEFEIRYGEGIDSVGELIDLGAELNIIEKSGSWYSYEGERLGQGRDNARRTLLENEGIRIELDLRVREALGL